MIITLGGKKGGTAKTTLSVNIAIALSMKGHSVCLIDSDEKPDATDWIKDRRKYHYALPDVVLKCVRGDIEDTIISSNKKYDYVIVDVGGYDSDEMRDGLAVGDVFIAPFGASKFDMRTAKAINKQVKQAKVFNKTLRAFSVLVKVSTQTRSKRPQKTREQLEPLSELKLCRTRIYYREAWMLTADESLCVLELNDSKAKAELQCILEEILNDE